MELIDIILLVFTFIGGAGWGYSFAKRPRIEYPPYEPLFKSKTTKTYYEPKSEDKDHE